MYFIHKLHQSGTLSNAVITITSIKQIVNLRKSKKKIEIESVYRKVIVGCPGDS